MDARSAPGCDTHQARIPDELLAALLRLAKTMRMPLRSILLAAHFKVLSALSGERRVATGLVTGEGRSPLPCHMTTESRSWRALLLEAHRAANELSNSATPLEDIGLEPGLSGPWFETVFDPT